METFEKIISTMPKNFKVLDVGCYGHEGVNTSQFLAKHFDKVTGVAIAEKVKQFCAPNYEFIQDNFYDRKFTELYDLIVLDLTIELNLLNDWSNKGLERVHKLLKPGGYLINFVMATTEYGDPEVTPHLLKFHSKLWWGSDEITLEAVGKKLSTIKGFQVVHTEFEQRRPYILWVCLQKTSG